MLSSVAGECAPQRHLYSMLLIALSPAHSARHPVPTCLSAQYVRQVPGVMHGQREDGCERQKETELLLNTEVLAKICTSDFVLLQLLCIFSVCLCWLILIKKDRLTVLYLSPVVLACGLIAAQFPLWD